MRTRRTISGAKASRSNGRAIRATRTLTQPKRRRRNSREKQQRFNGASSVSRWFLEGMNDGRLWHQCQQKDDIPPEEARIAAFRAWSDRCYGGIGPKRVTWCQLLSHGRQYAAGFLQRYADAEPILPVPLRMTAAAVVCATLPLYGLQSVLKELDSLPLRQIIVVIFGVPADKLPTIPARPHTVVVVRPEVADPDVGRAIGANLANADTLLFVDGKRPVAASVLARFLWECDGRADIALNDLPMNKIWFHQRGGIPMLQEFLNASLNRRDLKSNSLAVLPYALSRQALDTIGAATLCVPAKAHAVAIMSKLRIVSGGAAGNPFPSSPDKSVSRTVAGDHAEAWYTAIAKSGSRLKRPDLNRNRAILEDRDR